MLVAGSARAAPFTEPAPEPSAWRTSAIVASMLGGTLAYGHAKWWQDGYSSGFRNVEEGWFGRGTEYGGADKLGHAMFAYSGTRLMAHAFGWAGHEPVQARRYAAWTAVGTLMAVEVIDGYSKRWRFSKEDAIANVLGGALGWAMETHPEVDALIDLRLQYSRSSGPQGKRSFSPFGDYSGQRYLLVLKASGVPQWRHHPWLRYLEISVGYGAKGFEEDARALSQPSRHVYYGVSLNLTEVLRATVFSAQARPSHVQRLSETFFEYVQVPAAVAAHEQRID